MDRKRAAEQHSLAGNSPGAWASCAESLRVAADTLHQQRPSGPSLVPGAWRTHPPELMLRGMVVECLLKALWLTRGGSLVEDGQYSRIPGARDHDLVQLAKVLQLRLSDEERHLLRRLSAFIQYGGRYPIPKKAEDLQLIASPTGGRTAATVWTTPSDYLLFDGIADRLQVLVEQASA